MAISASTVFEVRTTGSDSLCSGGFVTGATGTDYSQQDSAQYTGTDLVIDGTTNTKVTSATHNFVAADVGNLIQITAGTGFTTGFFQIVSVASNAATLDRSAGTLSSTGGTYAVGGALASPGKAVGAAVSSNTIWIRYGTYSVSSTTANVGNGRLNLTQSSSLTSAFAIRGYDTVRGDHTANRPILSATVNGLTAILLVGSNDCVIDNLVLDGNGHSPSAGLQINASYNRVSRCKVLACALNFYINQTSNIIEECESVSASNVGFYSPSNANFISYCYAKGSTNSGFLVGSVSLMNCISASNGVGFQHSITGICQSCTAYNNSGAGFSNSNTVALLHANCVAVGNSGYGFDPNDSGTGAARLINCAGYNNTSGSYRNTSDVQGFANLTSNPFDTAAIAAITDLASAFAAFRPNSTAGGGALLRGAGLIAYGDIGAAQHQDSGGFAPLGAGLIGVG